MSSSQIYEQHYRRLDVSVPLRARRWIPIAREGLKALFSYRAFLGLIAIGWLQMFGRLVQIYILTRFPDARRIMPVDDKLFFDYLVLQTPWMFLMAAYAGAGLIANDMRTGGLLLYLSRPLTLSDYITGKFAIVFAALSMVTLVPGLLLFIGGRSLAPDALGDATHLMLIPKVIAASLVMIVPTIGIVLAMSALAKNPRFAGLGFFFIFVGSMVGQAIVRRATRSGSSGLLSVQLCIQRVNEWIFSVKSTRVTSGMQPEVALVVLIAISIVCLVILRTRVRAVEVVR
jgi:ABC-type transport system involved in multi-copper enzyme maturation permease subunit